MNATELIIKEAVDRGIEVEWVIQPSSYMLKYNGRTEYFYYRYWSKQGLLPFKLCENKEDFKKLMLKNNLPAAIGKGFGATELHDAKEYCKKICWPVVLKPYNESYGRGVCLSLKDVEEFSMSWLKLAEQYETLIVEKMYIGEEYRIFVTNEKVIGVLNRIPANVTGDGKHTIRELVAIKNADPVRNACKSMKEIIIDDAVIAKLQEENLALDTQLPNGKSVRLRYASNIRLGGDSRDVTDTVHPSVREIAVKAIQAIPHLKYGGLDFMTEDITVDQRLVNHAIIELNKSPGIGANHDPLEGKPRNCAGAIIDLVFPETAVKEEG